MPFKNFINGSRLDDTDLNRYWLQQAHVIKAADESVTNSTTMQDDNHLVLPLLANTEYWLECFIIYGANNDADIRIDFIVPSGATYDFTHGGIRVGHISADGFDNISRSRFQEISTQGTIGGFHDTANTDLGVIPLEGKIVVGATAGNLQFQWAQNTANATATVVKANSLLVLQRLTV